MRTVRPPHRLSPTPFAAEALEPRQLLAAITWDGGAGDNLWHSPANWNTDTVPAAADDVTISVAGTPTILFNADTGPRTVNSLICNEALTITGGSLTVATTADINATLRLDGGELAGSAWDFAGGQLSAGVSEASRIAITSVAGPIVIPDSGGRLKIAGSLVLNGSITTPLNAAQVKFEGTSPSLTGNAQVLFAYGYPDSGITWDAAATLTLGPQVTVRSADAGGWGGLSGGSLVNHGTIGSASIATWMNISLSGTFTNTGTVQSAIQGTVSIAPAFLVNTGTFRVDAGGSMGFGGTYTRAQLGTLIQTGGNVGFGGTFDNTGASIDLLNATFGGTIIGGTMNLAPGGTLISVYGDRRAVLKDISINGTVGMSFSANLTLTGSTRFTAFRCTVSGFLYLDDGFVLRDPIIMESTSSSHTLYIDGARDNYPLPPSLSTVTIAPTGSITVAPGSPGKIELYDHAFGPIAVVNQGLIACDSASGQLTLAPISLINQGTIRFNGVTSIAAPSVWSNSGTLEFAGGTASLGGTWDATQGEGTFAYTAGAVQLSATINNAGNLFELGPASGNWFANGATINDGSLTLYPPTPRLSVGSLTLNNVHVLGDISTGAFGTLVVNGIADGVFRVNAANGSLVFAPGTVLTGEVIAEGAAPTGAAALRLSAPGAFTIAFAASIRTDAAFVGTLNIGDAAAAMTLQNFGTISALGGTLSVNAASFTNMSLISFGPGATFQIGAGGVWNTNGPNGIATVISGGGTLAIAGTVNNALSTLLINAATGSWTMRGGTISGGTLAFSDSRSLLFTANSSGRLENVNVQGELTINNTSSGVTLAGTTTTGTIHLAAPGSSAAFAPGHFFGGLIQIEGQVAGARSIISSFEAGAPRGLAAGGIIRILPGSAGDLSFSGSQPLTILGQVQGQAIGRAITLQVPTIFGPGASLSTIGPLTVTGLTQVQGASLGASGGAGGGGDITLSSAGSLTFGGTITFANTAEITGDGSLSVSGAATFASRVNITGPLSVTAGAANFQGGFASGPFSVSQGATVSFNLDSVVANATNAGTINLFARVLQTIGNYTQTPTGTLGVRLNFSSGSSGLLAVGGTAFLAGAANITQIGTPVRGNWVRIIDAPSISGQFATITTPTPGSGSKYAPIYEPTRVRILFTWTADWDNSGGVDPSDVAAMVNSWFTGLTTGTLAGDFDGNTQVQPADIALFVQTWLQAIG